MPIIYYYFLKKKQIDLLDHIMNKTPTNQNNKFL